MTKTVEAKDRVVIKFAGDSGDGMQLTGNQFTNNTALAGNDLATFPDFPAEIRAPQGTLAGVSGFQLHFSSKEIFTPGDNYDVLVAMNAAALKTNIEHLKPGGTVIANTSGFDSKNLRLAYYDANPLENGSLDGYKLIKVDITTMTRECLKDSSLGTREKDRSKNMFVLGFLYWMYNRSMDNTIQFLERKFGNEPEILDANIQALKAGYYFGDTSETFTTRYEVEAADISPGVYRSIMGNQATAFGLISASKKSGLPLFLGSYPITPASDILHELSKHKNFNVRTFQAEDEIAAISAAIGASFGGHLAVTTTSGPGMALKGEAIGLAIMLEIPLVICNIQRAGPSTGMPTKTEQSDLLQALYGRNGEAPVPVIAANSPSDCFDAIYEACKIAIQHMTPVIFLSDGYIANGAEPWKFPKAENIAPIPVQFAGSPSDGLPYLPYQRNEKLARPWARPGTPGLEHRIGGLEKEAVTGNVSYNPENHEAMVKMRAKRIEKIADYLPDAAIDSGSSSGSVLVIGWGSTYGSIKAAIDELAGLGHADIGHVHLRYLNPLPHKLKEIIDRFEQVLIPEMNNGQLLKVIRNKFLVDARGLNKIKGLPFSSEEVKAGILDLIA